MTPSSRWEQWEGYGYPAVKTNPVVYFYPGKVDIENTENRDDLAIEIHRDGIAPTKRAAHDLLDAAVVVHGQVEEVLGERTFFTGETTDYLTYEAYDVTWVELDEYSD